MNLNSKRSLCLSAVALSIVFLTGCVPMVQRAGATPGAIPGPAVSACPANPGGPGLLPIPTALPSPGMGTLPLPGGSVPASSAAKPVSTVERFTFPGGTSTRTFDFKPLPNGSSTSWSESTQWSSSSSTAAK